VSFLREWLIKEANLEIHATIVDRVATLPVIALLEEVEVLARKGNQGNQGNQAVAVVVRE
jgi:hypothetical protein